MAEIVCCGLVQLLQTVNTDVGWLILLGDYVFFSFSVISFLCPVKLEFINLKLEQGMYFSYKW